MISANFALHLLSQMIRLLFDVIKLLHLKLKLNRTFDSSSMKIILKLIACVSTLVLVQGCSKDSKKNNNSNGTPPPQVEVMIPMVSTWRTSSSDEIVELPLKSGYNYDFTVDWGDGSSESVVTSYEDPDKSHTYAASGDYTITLKGLVEAWGTTEEETGTSPIDPGTIISSPHQDQIIRVDNLGRVGWLDLSFAFYNCQNLTSVSGGDTSSVTDMRFMFRRATSATPDVGSWNTSSVTDMGYMFSGASSATPDVGDWDTSKVTDMSNMFWNATSANPDVGDWDTSKVTDMNNMFQGATSANPDVSNWDTSSVLYMIGMFRRASSANPDVGDWNTSNITNMSYMFRGATSANPDAGGWNTSNVINMKFMFFGATSANPDVGEWDTSKVISMESMFLGATSANPDVGEWDTSNVTVMTTMFFGATSANPDLSGFDFEALTSPPHHLIRESGISIVNYSNLLVRMNSQGILVNAVSNQFSSPVKYIDRKESNGNALIEKSRGFTHIVDPL